jgi:hypothetical protein
MARFVTPNRGSLYDCTFDLVVASASESVVLSMTTATLCRIFIVVKIMHSCGDNYKCRAKYAHTGTRAKKIFSAYCYLSFATFDIVYNSQFCGSVEFFFENCTCMVLFLFGKGEKCPPHANGARTLV